MFIKSYILFKFTVKLELKRSVQLDILENYTKVLDDDKHPTKAKNELQSYIYFKSLISSVLSMCSDWVGDEPCSLRKRVHLIFKSIGNKNHEVNVGEKVKEICSRDLIKEETALGQAN